MRHGALPADVAATCADADLIVNTTSLGMTPNIETTAMATRLTSLPIRRSTIWSTTRPQPDSCRKAAAHGARTIGGLGMLIWQGAIAFELWTGNSRPSR